MIHFPDQFLQCLDGQVDRIGNRAGNIFGDGHPGSQIASCRYLHFIEQTQYRLLGGFDILFTLVDMLAQTGGKQMNEYQTADDGQYGRQIKQHGCEHACIIVVLSDCLFDLADQCRQAVAG